jgi:hypothetical protein
MAYTTINKSTDYFNTVAYTGNGASDRAVTSGFATDFVWIKNRGTTDDHVLFDKVRGGTKYLYSNQTAAEATYSSQDVTFESTGVDVGSYQSINQNSGNIVSWHWRGNGAGSSNTDGSINTTYTSVNTTAGFSISTYTGTGSNATVGHGLGVAPKMIIIKNLSASQGWCIYHESIGATKFLSLNSNDAQVTASDRFNNTSPTSSVFSVGSHADTNGNGNNMIAYCFAEKTGYSKFGTVNGNGNNDGPFVYTGFAPSFVLYKKYNGAGDWYFVDNKRPGYNDNDKRLYANTNQAEETYDLINLYSNGFKLTNSTHAYTNDSAGTYLYMAFGQSLVGSNNIPATAR